MQGNHNGWCNSTGLIPVEQQISEPRRWAGAGTQRKPGIGDKCREANLKRDWVLRQLSLSIMSSILCNILNNNVFYPWFWVKRHIKPKKPHRKRTQAINNLTLINTLPSNLLPGSPLAKPSWKSEGGWVLWLSLLGSVFWAEYRVDLEASGRQDWKEQQESS